MSDQYHVVPDVPRHQGICPHCHHELVDVLPVHPIFSLPAAARLIPCALTTLQRRLVRHKKELGPALYRKDSRQRPHRYLRAWEIALLRNHMILMRPPGGGKLQTAHHILQMVSNDGQPRDDQTP